MSGETPATNAVRREQLVARVVEARDEQRDDLHPDAHRVQAADRVEDRLEPSAELAIVAIVEALEIDLVEIDPRPQVFEDLRRAVAVRHEAGDEARGFGLLEHRDRPLARDQRLVVRADDHARAESLRVAHHRLGRRVDRRRHGGRIAQRLRRDPVLAVRAVQIAAEHAEAVRERAGVRVEERLLLDRIALHAADVSPRHAQACRLR